MRNTFFAVSIAALLFGFSSQKLTARSQKGSPDEIADQQKSGFVPQKLTPFATAVQRPKEWFFWTDDAGGDFTWIISKNKVAEPRPQFEKGVEIKAFYNVSEKKKKTPEDFATEYLKTRVETQDMKVLNRMQGKAGPLSAITQTIELPKEILATDLYWGDGNTLDVVVVVTRKSPKQQWNSTQPIFRNLTRFSLQTIVQGTREKTPVNDSQQK